MEPSPRGPERSYAASEGHKGATRPVLAGSTGKCSPEQKKNRGAPGPTVQGLEG